jgi:hypothetical protein
MEEDLGTLVERLDYARIILRKTINDFYSGKAHALDRLRPFFPDFYHQERFEWYASEMRMSPLRRNGDPSFIHPALAALLGLWVIPDHAQENKRTSISFILGHDWVEEGLQYAVEAFARAREQYPENEQEFTASVLLSSPQSTHFERAGIHDKLKLYLARKISPTLQVYLYSSTPTAMARVCDNVANMLDLDYLKGEKRKTEKIAFRYIAPLHFTLEKLGDRLPDEVITTMHKLVEYTIRTHRIRPILVNEAIQSYRRFFDSNPSALMHAIHLHLGDFKIPLPKPWPNPWLR